MQLRLFVRAVGVECVRHTFHEEISVEKVHYGQPVPCCKLRMRILDILRQRDVADVPICIGRSRGLLHCAEDIGLREAKAGYVDHFVRE